MRVVASMGRSLSTFGPMRLGRVHTLGSSLMAKHPHQHHTHSHHVRGCSPALMGSEALGFYLVSMKGEHVPICEIRSFGASLDEWHNIVYTGPGQKSASALKHKRTADDDALFDFKNAVLEENDIAKGGIAAIFHSRKRQSFDIWLFGPLLFLDRPFGSLVFELSHYSGRTVFMKRTKDQHVEWSAKFGDVPAGFNRCKVLQTTYFPQAGDRHPRDLTNLTAARASVAPVSLHPYVRAEWTVLSRIIGQTDCQVYDQEGL
jgi:hypothetical protein